MPLFRRLFAWGSTHSRYHVNANWWSVCWPRDWLFNDFVGSTFIFAKAGRQAGERYFGMNLSFIFLQHTLQFYNDDVSLVDDSLVEKQWLKYYPIFFLSFIMYVLRGNVIHFFLHFCIHRTHDYGGNEVTVWFELRYEELSL